MEQRVYKCPQCGAHSSEKEMEKRQIAIEEKNGAMAVAQRHDMLIDAVCHAIRKHGRLTHDPTRMVTILTEEVGEAAEAALKMTSPKAYGTGYRRGWRIEMVKELYQVAATAMLAIVNLESVSMNEVTGEACEQQTTDSDRAGRTVGKRSEGGDHGLLDPEG